MTRIALTSLLLSVLFLPAVASAQPSVERQLRDHFRELYAPRPRPNEQADRLLNELRLLREQGEWNEIQRQRREREQEEREPVRPLFCDSSRC